jgi:hypothetical protein
MKLPSVLKLIIGIVVLTLSQGALACDQNGIGHAAANTRKAGMNILKNRRIDPTVTRRVSVAEILAYPDHEDPNIEASDGVVLTGQLLQAVHEGAESPNCGAKYDYHIFIGAVDAAHPLGAHLSKAQVKSRKKRAVVVELTPNIQDLHPDWGDRLEQELAGKNVCIRGWLLYDYEHHPQIGHTRGTLWEVHPITGIALFQPDGSCAAWVTP